MAAPLNITFIGCGNMGRALLSAFMNSKIYARYHVLKPTPFPKDFLAALSSSDTNEGHLPPPNLHYVRYDKEGSGDAPDCTKALNDADVLIIAVKPQMFEEVCADLAKDLKKEALIVSIMAGVGTRKIQNVIGHFWPIVRAMPNTPALIGQSMTGAFATSDITPDHKKITEDLFASAGEFLWVSDEALMDAITAVAGSGPAYLFYFIEALQNAALRAGFNSETASLLARQTVVGAAALAANDHDTPAASLRKNVTSPGGTTEAALKILTDGKFEKIIENAVQAAIRRGKELNQ